MIKNIFFTIRKAQNRDAKNIHEAHMKSIREVCSADHSSEEIAAWGNRDFNEAQRVDSIANQFVYVVEMDNLIEGYMHFNILPNQTEIYVYALYLTKKCIGHGVGSEMMNLLNLVARQHHIKKITLHTTITAHSFYLKMGFSDTAAMTSVLVNNVPVRCTPMEKNLN